MSIWEDFRSKRASTTFSTSRPANLAHHFGRPFLTAYQIAISFTDRFPDDRVLIGKQIGDKGTGLSQYIARELSDRIKKDRLTGVESADLHHRYFSFLEKRSSISPQQASAASWA